MKTSSVNVRLTPILYMKYEEALGDVGEQLYVHKFKIRQGGDQRFAFRLLLVYYFVYMSASNLFSRHSIFGRD